MLEEGSPIGIARLKVVGVKGSRMSIEILPTTEFIRKNPIILEVYDDIMFQRHLVKLMTAEFLLCRRLGVSKESLMDYMVKE